jgi:hypothetical protein
VATAGGWGPRVTGLAAGTALETTARAAGWGQATRQRRLEAHGGQVHGLAVTGSGGPGRRWSAAVTPRPWAVHGGPRQAPAAR